MAMSDCEKCWDTPCHCGHQYRKYTKAKRMEIAGAVLGLEPEELEKILEHHGVTLPPPQEPAT